VRYHHRVKTHGDWLVTQPGPGVHVWRSPTRHVFLVNPEGTHPLGDSAFATAVWHTALRPAHECTYADRFGLVS